MGERGVLLIAHMRAVYDQYQPTRVVYEKPIVVHRGGKTRRPDSLEFLRNRYGMDFLVETYFTGKGIPVEDVGLHAMKRELTGNSDADKDDMVQVARKCGLVLPKVGDDDAADAFAAWLIDLRKVNRTASARWDAVVWGQRGALL